MKEEEFKLIELMESEYKTISEFSEAVVQTIKKPLEQYLPPQVPGTTDKRWRPRQAYSINPATFNHFIECQLLWWYAFGESKKPFARLYIGVLPREQSWQFLSSIYIHAEMLKHHNTTKDSEGNLVKYIESRNLEKQIKVIELLEPWEGIVFTAAVIEAIQNRDIVLKGLQAGVQAVQLLDAVGKSAKT